MAQHAGLLLLIAAPCCCSLLLLLLLLLLLPLRTLMRLSGSRLTSPPIMDCPTSTFGAGGGDAGRGASLT
jgi:hypothetical protein